MIIVVTGCVVRIYYGNWHSLSRPMAIRGRATWNVSYRRPAQKFHEARKKEYPMNNLLIYKSAIEISSLAEKKSDHRFPQAKRQTRQACKVWCSSSSGAIEKTWSSRITFRQRPLRFIYQQ